MAGDQDPSFAAAPFGCTVGNADDAPLARVGGQETRTTEPAKRRTPIQEAATAHRLAGKAFRHFRSAHVSFDSIR